jgi:hypothetical protein
MTPFDFAGPVGRLASRLYLAHNIAALWPGRRPFCCLFHQRNVEQGLLLPSFPHMLLRSLSR